MPGMPNPNLHAAMKVDPNVIVSKAVKSLHDNNKLLLVLDIDHTLVHCTKDDRAAVVLSDPTMRSETFKMYFEETGDKPYFLKLRPFIKQFLETLSQFFHLAVYTMGGKTYAKKVMNIIDPDGTILKGRLVCRDDHADNVKKLQRMFPCDERMVLVVDDRDDVWSTPQNVLKIWKFRFWPSDANDADDGMMAPSENPNRTPDEDWALDKMRQQNHDNILGTTANVLQAIHRIYYHNESLYRQHLVSACKIYADLQKRVFSGVNIVFSGVFPNNERPEERQEWKLAVQYGAQCHLELNDRVTHVVAARAGTAKVHKARKMDVYVVHINWLRQSVIHFIRMFEPDFPIGSRVKAPQVSAHCSRPIDIMELSDFILDPKKNKPKIFRPSELYLPSLDPQNAKYDKEKAKKYKYFVQQRDALLKRIAPKKAAAPVAPPAPKVIPTPAAPAVSGPAPKGPFRYPPNPSGPPPANFPPQKSQFAPAQGNLPILNSRLPPTGAAPLMAPVGTVPLVTTGPTPMRRALRRPKNNGPIRPPKVMGEPLMPPQNNGIHPPQTKGVHPPQKNGLPPQNNGLRPPQNNGLPPQNNGVRPPQNNGIRPTHNNSVPPQNNGVRPPPRMPPIETSDPATSVPPVATLQEKKNVINRIADFLEGRYWQRAEVIYVHIRQYFDEKLLMQLGLDKPESFYKNLPQFCLNSADRGFIVRLSNDNVKFSSRDSGRENGGKRTSSDIGQREPHAKRKKLSHGGSRPRSPVPSYENVHRKEKKARDKFYDQASGNRESKNAKRRKTRNKRYGPPGQERPLHPLDPGQQKSHQKCAFYVKGMCNKLACPFLHENIQLYMRPPNDEWEPLSDRNQPPDNRKNKRKQKRRTSENSMNSEFDSHDRRSKTNTPNKERETITITDDEHDYFSPRKGRRDDDDDFNSLLKQHLGDNYETPRKSKRRKRMWADESDPGSSSKSVEKKKLKKSTEPEAMFDEEGLIVGIVEQDDEEEEGECSDSSDDDIQAEK